MINEDSIKDYITNTFSNYASKLGGHGYKWADSDKCILESSKSFMNSFNQLQLVFNYNENLRLKEDLSIIGGMSTYGIDLPLEQLRFPSKNNPNDFFSFEEMSPEEAEQISKILQHSKNMWNYKNDNNVIREAESRFEYITLFSLFEGFCESFLIEKSGANDDKAIKAIGDFIRHNNTNNIVERVLSYYDFGIKSQILLSMDYFDKLLKLLYLLRNLYVHRNGIVTPRFMKECTDEKSKILSFYYYDKENNRDIYSVTFITGEYTVWEGKNFNCQLICPFLRAFALDFVNLIEFLEKDAQKVVL